MSTPTIPFGPRSPALWQLFHYTVSPLTFMESCARKYGVPFTIRLAGYGKFVMLTDAEAIKDVFRADAASLHSGEGNEYLSLLVGKHSLLVLDEELHARQRQVLLPPLKGERMRAFFDSMQSATLDAMKRWNVGQTLNMLNEMQDITLRVILEVVLGLTDPVQIEAFTKNILSMLSYGRHRFTFVFVKITPFGLFKKMPWLPYFRDVREFDRAVAALIHAQRANRPASAAKAC